MSDPIAASTIAAQAFRFMELGAISSFADDSEQASAAAEQYPNALDMALETYDWSFARHLVTLSPATLGEGEIADPDLPHAYALPADCLALRNIHLGDCFAWRIDGRLIRADRADGLTIRYTRRITRETDLPRLFQVVVSYQLAILLAPRFIGSRTKLNDLKADLQNAFDVATRADAHTASHARLDGLGPQPDWAREAVTNSSTRGVS